MASAVAPVADRVVDEGGGQSPFRVKDSAHELLQLPGDDRGRQRQQQGSHTPGGAAGDGPSRQHRECSDGPEEELADGGGGRVTGVVPAMARDAEDVVRLGDQSGLEAIREQEDRVNQGEAAESLLA